MKKNDEAINTTTNSIVETLKAQVTSGNLSSITDMFKSGNVNASGINSSVQNNVVTDLMKKFGIDNAQASNIASTLLPKVMEQFVSKTNDPNDKSFDVTSIMSSLGGGNAAGDVTSTGVGNGADTGPGVSDTEVGFVLLTRLPRAAGCVVHQITES